MTGKLHKNESFQNKILDKFQNNEAGKLCQKNQTIQEMGYRIFCKRQHEDSKAAGCRKVAMTEMRQLANLFLEYKSLQGVPFTGVSFGDMFRSGADNMDITIESEIRTAQPLEALYDEQSRPDKVEEMQ